MLYYLYGTFVACILLPNSALLFSDGLVTLNRPNEPKIIYSTTFSKIHQINNHCAFLTYGRFLPDLESRAQDSIKVNDSPIEIGRKFSIIMKELWEDAPKENVKTGAMIISFQNNIPYCFVVESTTNLPFKPGPLVMPTIGQDLRIGAVCHDEEKYKSSNRLKNQIQILIDKNITLNQANLRNAFDIVKNNLEKECDDIGGTTFELLLHP